MKKISERINDLIRKNGITQNELSQKTGISKQVISGICHGKVKHSKAFYPIAKYFGVEYNWLVNENETHTYQSMVKQPNDDVLILDRFKKIPLLTTRILDKGMLIDGKLNLDNVTDDYDITNDPNHKYLFTLISTNNSLKFRFGDNCALIFHTNLEPITGDFVIAYLPEKELFVYRDLEINDGEKILTPVDQDIYKKIILKNTDNIVAVLYEKRIKRPFV